MKKFFNEFREFAMRGNVLDMAIGVVLGSAFGKITTSLVNDVFMPLIGLVIGGIDLGKLDIILKPAVMNGDKEVTAAVTLGLGTFLTTIIDFILVAFVIFLMVKAINAFHKKKDEAPAPEEPAGAEILAGQQLLTRKKRCVGCDGDDIFRTERLHCRDGHKCAARTTRQADAHPVVIFQYIEQCIIFRMHKRLIYKKFKIDDSAQKKCGIICII